MSACEYRHFSGTDAMGAHGELSEQGESNRERKMLTSTESSEVLYPSESSEDTISEASDHAPSIELSPMNQISLPLIELPSPLPSNTNQRRRKAVFLFSITTILLFADQNLLSPNLSAIATEFGFTDEERDRKLGGHIALAFFILGAPASVLVGLFADQSDRSFLFAWTVGIGEGACFATFWTRTYPQLYICRAITGFSIGGSLPLIYSVLGDLFVAEDRHAVSAVIGIGTGVGIAFGQGVAGFLGPTFGWRLPFLVVSIPALVCAALVLFTVPVPERGSMERAVIDMQQNPVENGDNETDEQGEVLSESAFAASSIEIHSLKQSDSHDAFQAEANPMMKTTKQTEFKRRVKRESQSLSAQSNDDLDSPDGLFVSADSWDSSNSRLSCGQDWALHFMSLLSLLSCPTVLLTFLQGAPGCLPWGIVNSFLNDFLAQDRGMTVEVSRSRIKVCRDTSLRELTLPLFFWDTFGTGRNNRCIMLWFGKFRWATRWWRRWKFPLQAGP